MTVGAVLAGKGKEVATIESGASIRDAVAQLASRRIGALVVVDDGRLVGILSERDCIQCLVRHGERILDLPVAQAMTSPVVAAEPDMPVLAALGLMTQRRFRHLPVTEGGALAGIVSIGDLVKYRMERIEAEANAMRAYIQSA